MKAVIDTNILVSSLKSNKGYSFELIERMFKGEPLGITAIKPGDFIKIIEGSQDFL